MKHFNIDKISKWKYEFDMEIKFFGYDVKEENYLNGWYCQGWYSVKDVLMLKKAQPLLRKHYRQVDISKSPSDFYEGERDLDYFKGIINEQ